MANFCPRQDPGPTETPRDDSKPFCHREGLNGEKGSGEGSFCDGITDVLRCNSSRSLEAMLSMINVNPMGIFRPLGYQQPSDVRTSLRIHPLSPGAK